jgi:hypothetical protein
MVALGALLVAGLLALAAPVVVLGGVAAMAATATGVATARTLRRRRRAGHDREVCLPKTRVCVAV